MRSHLVKEFFRTRLAPSSGLTLIELLVVVTVAGILAAISLPSFLSRANAAKQVEAKNFVSALNRAQLAYYTEHGGFTDKIEELILKIQNGNYYNYTVSVGSGQPYAVHHALPKSASLRAYVGMTAIITLPTSEATSHSVLCESDNYVSQAPDPQYQSNAATCATGSRPLN